jgi:hypothetical protein
MSRFLAAAVAFVVFMPDVALMQVIPSQPAPPDLPVPPAAIAMEASQDTPRATTPRPGVPSGDAQGPPGTPRAAQGPPPPTPPPPPAPTAALHPPRMMRGRDINVQIELTISDHLGNAAPDKRVVSMLVADGAFGRIRSIADASIAVLNVDARPEILENDRIVLEMTVEYKPLGPDGATPAKRPAPLNEQLTVILQNGKPLLVSQAADPMSDRKMTVEVRASILK